MLTQHAKHTLTRDEADWIKRALLEQLAPVSDPESMVRALIVAFRVVDEATAARSDDVAAR